MSSSSDRDDDVAKTLPPEEHLGPRHLHQRRDVQKPSKPVQQPLDPESDDDNAVLVAKILPPEEHLGRCRSHRMRHNVQKLSKPAQQPLEPETDDNDKVPSTFPSRSVFNNPKFSIRKALVNSDDDFIKDQSSGKDEIPLSQIQKQAQSHKNKSSRTIVSFITSTYVSICYTAQFVFYYIILSFRFPLDMAIVLTSFLL